MFIILCSNQFDSFVEIANTMLFLLHIQNKDHFFALVARNYVSNIIAKTSVKDIGYEHMFKDILY